jgi:hypothetical protein
LSTARQDWSSSFSSPPGKGSFSSPPTFQNVLVNHGDASIHGGGGGGGFRQISAKYPALLFKQQLDACMGNLFFMLRNNINKDMNSPLGVTPLSRFLPEAVACPLAQPSITCHGWHSNGSEAMANPVESLSSALFDRWTCAHVQVNEA